jgi:hypothetical protein
VVELKTLLSQLDLDSIREEASLAERRTPDPY